MHWSERYIRRSYAKEYDCADFVRDVMAEQFGRDLPLPSIHAAYTRERDRQMRCAAEALAEPVDAPREGDAVLMRAAGRRRDLGHHVGVWCDIGGRPHVLHRMAGIGAVLHPIDRLVGLEVAGIYRWL